MYRKPLDQAPTRVTVTPTVSQVLREYRSYLGWPLKRQKPTLGYPGLTPKKKAFFNQKQPKLAKNGRFRDFSNFIGPARKICSIKY